MVTGLFCVQADLCCQYHCSRDCLERFVSEMTYLCQVGR